MDKGEAIQVKMDKREIIRVKMEEIFKELNYHYELWENKSNKEDDDINYAIIFPPSKAVKRIGGLSALLYIKPDNNSLHMIAINIYRFNEYDDKVQYLKMLNDINIYMDYGAFNIDSQTNQIVYTTSVILEDDMSDLSAGKVSALVDEYIKNLMILVEKINRIKDGN